MSVKEHIRKIVSNLKYMDPYGDKIITEIKSIITSYNFELIATGNYSEVYGSSGPFVIKLLTQSDPSYLSFIKNKDINPHYPQTEYLTFGIDQAVIFIERLEPVEYNDPYIAKLISRWNNFRGDYIRDKDDYSWNMEEINKNKEMIIENKSLFYAMMKLKRKCKNSIWDIHCDNIMWRDDTLVLTDPFSFQKE